MFTYLFFNKFSLKSLILLGFFVSLIPLVVLASQSLRFQKKISDSWFSFTVSSNEITQNAVEMENSLINIERSIKQFKVIESFELKEIAIDGLQRYQRLTEKLCSSDVFNNSDLCDRQFELMGQLAGSFSSLELKVLDQLLTQLKENQKEFMNSMWMSIAKAKQSQVDYVRNIQFWLLVWLLMSLTLTMAILIFVSRQLVSPVNFLERKIKRIGEALTQNTHAIVAFHGPKELQVINEKLNWLSAHLNNIEKSRQLFLRHASHEFKTPLSSIVEGCSILHDQLSGPLNRQQLEVLGLVQKSGSRLVTLTEELIEYSSLFESTNTAFEKIDLSLFISEIEQQFAQSFRSRHQNLVIDCPIRSMFTDMKLFSRIIVNLLSNAKAYGNNGGKVLLNIESLDNSYQIIVANTGPRINLHIDSQLLEPFVRGNALRYDSLSGSGLGLSIVNDCVKLLKGELIFDQLEGYDFCVKITLPNESI